MRILAISDIHGCLYTFKALLKQINFSKKDRLYLIGDFIDRGPYSKGVIDHVWYLIEEGYSITCIKGNHEQMLLNGITDFDTAKNWLFHGGSQTLDSFKAMNLAAIPKKYIDWMKSLPHSVATPDYIFVHAGLNFDVPNPYEAKHSMLWIRNWYENINYNWLGKRIIVHGHTPFQKKSIEEMFNKIDYLQAIDIDAGCCFDYEGLGHLCCVDLTNRQLYFKKRIR